MDQANIKLLMFENDDMMQTLASYLTTVDKVHPSPTTQIDTRIARMLPESMAKRFCLIPIGKIDNHIVVAMANPLDVHARDTVRLPLDREITVAISSRQEILDTIEAVYHGSDVVEQHLRTLVEHEAATEEKDIILENGSKTDVEVGEEATQPSVIKFVNLLLEQAIQYRASDIHLEPQETSMIVRMRIDGVLEKTVTPPRKMQAAIVSRIKVRSNMDISERRLPQDGRFKAKVADKEIDVRVSIIPTRNGEKLVMRILDSSAVNYDLDQLGFEPKLLEKFKVTLSQPYGIIIITGPTGSGKTTTLYSALNYLRSPGKNITTVEDPIEYTLEEINQIQVKPGIGLDFASCLRAILRQDPDIILIGEIRDKETADIAIKASLTGHLVLSTFHTNDAPGAISRLINMGIEPYLLSSSLNLIIAQRLVRKICENCKEPIELDEKTLNLLKISPDRAKNITFYHGKGCENCNGRGYRGRLPIFEFLAMDSNIREQLTANVTESQIRAMARKKGYMGLFEDGVNKILQGLTTAEEVLRVTFWENEGL